MGAIANGRSADIDMSNCERRMRSSCWLVVWVPEQAHPTIAMFPRVTHTIRPHEKKCLAMHATPGSRDVQGVRVRTVLSVMGLGICRRWQASSSSALSKPQL